MLQSKSSGRWDGAGLFVGVHSDVWLGSLVLRARSNRIDLLRFGTQVQLPSMWALHDSFFEHVETLLINFLGYRKRLISEPQPQSIFSAPSSLARELCRCCVIPSSLRVGERIRHQASQPFGRIRSSHQFLYAFFRVRRAIWTQVSHQVYLHSGPQLIPGALIFGRRQTSLTTCPLNDYVAALKSPLGSFFLHPNRLIPISAFIRSRQAHRRSS